MATITVINPGFEAAFTGWTAVDATISAINPFEGTQSAQLGTTAGALLTQTGIYIPKNNNVYLQVYLMNSGTVDRPITLQGNTSTAIIFTIPADNTWRLYTVEFTSNLTAATTDANTITISGPTAVANSVVKADAVSVIYDYVENGTFNEGSGATITDWTSTGASVGLASILPELVIEGTPIIGTDPHSEINSVNMGVTRVAGVAQLPIGAATSITQTGIPVIVGQDYIFSFWYKTEGIVTGTVLTGGVFTGVATFIAPINLVIPIGTIPWTQYTDTFTATATTVGVTFTPALSANLFIDDVAITPATQAAVLCYSGDSIVQVKNTTTQVIESIKVKHIDTAVHHIYEVTKQAYVPIKKLSVSGSTTRYMLFAKDCLGHNMPNQDLKITSGHYIIHNGIKQKANKFKEAKRTKVPSEPVYTIYLDYDGAIELNGLQVEAAAADKLIQYREKQEAKLGVSSTKLAIA
ncbi:Hypothetical protein MVR_LOCUS104 [uncultured virus]|nr:Hypothetical protein MVR_LOCUS104 [uncultured virus]